MNTAYWQGYAEGESDFGDSRSCPYEGTKNVNDWLDGFYAGQASKKQAEKNNAAQKPAAKSR